MKRVMARLFILPIFLLSAGNGYELTPEEEGVTPEEEGASPDESWECDGPRADLSLVARHQPVGDHVRIDLEFENRTEFPVSYIQLGAGGRYEWGNDPNELPPIETSIRAPKEWSGRLGYQFEGVMMTVHWRVRDVENRVLPGGRLEGLSFETEDERLPPTDLPFEVSALGKACMWSRWTLEAATSEGEK